MFAVYLNYLQQEWSGMYLTNVLKLLVEETTRASTSQQLSFGSVGWSHTRILSRGLQIRTILRSMINSNTG